MNRSTWWWLAKSLEGVGMVIVLVGVFISISEGLADRGLASMAYEFQGLFLGGALFLVGVAIERRLGRK